MSIAREGWPFIVTLAAAGGLLVVLRQPLAGAVVLGLGFFTAFFFRDPERAVPLEPGLLLSPADGRVVRVVPAPDGHPLGPGTVQVSIFLSVFDVHVNRAPIGGRIAAVEYHAGEFLPAFDDKASLRNEQNTVTIEEGPTRVIFKQIAGILARRIVFRKRVDDRVAAGERVGLIRFGSRVDLFVPPPFVVRARVGDRVRGGASVLGERPPR
jgi:phosphatidylserine decarboxylase